MTLSVPTITPVNSPGGRHYHVEGFAEPFPSVTTVLGIISKPALIPWARNVAFDAVRASLANKGGMAWVTPDWINDVVAEGRRLHDEAKDAAADFGTEAHALIEAVISGIEPAVPQEMRQVIAGFEAWREGTGLDIQFTETPVYSTKHRYAGTMDAVAYRGRTQICLDWKTSNGLYPEYALQLAAYAKALEEMTGRPVDEAWVIRFGKVEAEFEAKRVIDLDAAFAAFRSALDLWRAMQDRFI